MDPDLKHLMGGSVAAGTGIGLLSVLYDAIRSERRRTEAVRGRGEKDVLEISLPKPTNKQALMEPGVLGQALLGVLLAGGSAAAVQKAYKAYKKKQLKAETEGAVGDYMQDLSKSAKVDGGSFLAGLPADIIYLSGLAGAAGTYGLLEHTFPKTKEKQRDPGTPRTIRVKGYGPPVVVDGPGDGPLGEEDKRKGKSLNAPVVPIEEERLKAATGYRVQFSVTQDDHLKAASYLCMSLGASHKFAASHVFELLGAYQENPRQLTQTIKEAGWDAAISTSKGGHKTYQNLRDIEKQELLKKAFADPVVSPGLALYALGEFNELDPVAAKAASLLAQNEENFLLLTKVASTLHFLDSPMTKYASESSEANMATLGVDSFDYMGEDQEEADEAYSGKEDPIDSFMAGKS